MKTYISIEYLRASCMLYIVGFWHLFDYTDALPAYNNFLTENFTRIALGLFVLISGFLLSQKAEKTSIKTFYKKRLLRIFPLYCIALIVFAIFGINDFVTTIKSTVLISMFSGPPPRTLWFITMIMVFYALTPWLIRNHKSQQSFLFVSAALWFAVLAAFILFKSIDLRILLYLPCYCLGLFLGKFGMQHSHENTKPMLALLSLWFVLNLAPLQSWLIEQILPLPLILVSSYFIFTRCLSNESKFKRNSIVSWLSYCSFAMYLFHRPIYSMLIEWHFPAPTLPQILILAVPCIILIAVSAWIIQSAYDSSYQRLSQR